MPAVERKPSFSAIVLAVTVAASTVVPAASAASAQATRHTAAKPVRKPTTPAPAKRTAPAAPSTPAPVATPVPAAAGTDPEPIGNIADWFPADSYPPQARALGLEGRVAFSLDIDARGRITQCHIIETSGSDLLDSAACTQAIINGRFRPGRDGAGQAVAKAWHSTMRWKLAAGASSSDE